MANMLEKDWAFLREAVGDLENYLLSPELFWPLTATPGGGTGGGALQLTLGNLQLARARLAAVAWPPEQQVDLDELNQRVNDVHGRWRANWGRKASRESAARFKLWANYISDLSTESGRRGAGYAHEVRWRTILALLEDDIQNLAGQETQALAGLDARLRGISTPGPFVWEPEVEPRFPEAEYWYLYRQIQPNTIR